MNNKYAELVELLREYAEWLSGALLDDYVTTMRDAADAIEFLSAELEKKENGGWIKCSERMPEEHDSCLAKWYGTNRWTDEMWRKQSDDVLAIMEFEDGTRKTERMKTHDGKWLHSIYSVGFDVIAWQPLPEPYKESEEDTE